MSSWIAAGDRYSTHNQPMLPFYIVLLDVRLSSVLAIWPGRPATSAPAAS